MASLSASAAISLAWCAFAIWLGPRIGFVDRPDGSRLKTHTTQAVPLGGVGVFLGVHLAGAIGGHFDLYLLMATSLILALGVVDDRRDLSPRLRLAVEAVAASVLVFGVSGIEAGPVMLVLQVALVVFAVNAVNLFDGLDGLAASAAIVTALGIAWLALIWAQSQPSALDLSAALAGFLIVGWHPARVFLGDGGAYVVGMVLAYGVIGTSGGGVSELVLASALLGVFAIDVAVTLIRRKLNGVPLFEGDRSHLYDQLRDRGFGVQQVVGVAIAVQALIVVIVIATATWLSPIVADLVLAGVGAIFLALLVTGGYLRVDPS